MQAVHGGVHGYVLQDANPFELMDAIRHVARGGTRYLLQALGDAPREQPAAQLAHGPRGRRPSLPREGRL